MDKLTKRQRSECMARIKGKDTGLEKKFRKSVAALKIRGYRLNTKIPGKPDLYFPAHGVAVFIDGCFWHGCPRCYSRPTTNRKFWADKIKMNLKRDVTVNAELHKVGIRTIRFWGHEINKNSDRCAEKLQDFIYRPRQENSRKPKFSVKYKLK
jgi:DNA mismatch endonuclease (patch repair protein)